MDPNKEGENDKNIYKGLQQYFSEPEDLQNRRIIIIPDSREYISQSIPFEGL